MKTSGRGAKKSRAQAPARWALALSVLLALGPGLARAAAAPELLHRLSRLLDRGQLKTTQSLLRRHRLATEALPAPLRFATARKLLETRQKAEGLQLLESLSSEPSPLAPLARFELAKALLEDQPGLALEQVEHLDRAEGQPGLQLLAAPTRFRALAALGRWDELAERGAAVQDRLWNDKLRVELLSLRIEANSRLGRQAEVNELRARALKRHPRSSLTKRLMSEAPLRARLLQLLRSPPRRVKAKTLLRRAQRWWITAREDEREEAQEAFELFRASHARRTGGHPWAQELTDGLLASSRDEPLRALALWERARSLRRQDRDLEAACSYRQLAWAHPTDPLAPRALKEAAGLARLRDEPGLAALDLQRLSSGWPARREGAWARWALAWSALRDGSYARAQELLRPLAESTERGSGWSRGGLRERARYWRAWILAAQGRNAEAEQRWDELLQSAPLSYYGLLAANRLGRLAAGQAPYAALLFPRSPSGPPQGRLEGPIPEKPASPAQEKPTSPAQEKPTSPAQEKHASPAQEKPTSPAQEKHASPVPETPPRWDPEPPRAAALTERAELAAARALERAGLRDLARQLLRQLLRADALRQAEVDALAARHLAAGSPSLACRTERYRGELLRHPDARSLSRWMLAYPRPYRELVEERAAKEGIDPLLVWSVMRQESAYSPSARSGANALGLMQLLPVTARTLARQVAGVTVRRERDILDPEVNISLACRFLKQLIERFEGSVPLALAAYNAGPGYARRWVERWGSLGPDLLPEEIPIRQAHGYTKQVMQSYFTYRFLYGQPGEPPGSPSVPLVFELPAPGRDE